MGFRKWAIRQIKFNGSRNEVAGFAGLRGFPLTTIDDLKEQTNSSERPLKRRTIYPVCSKSLVSRTGDPKLGWGGTPFASHFTATARLTFWAIAVRLIAM